MTYALITDYYNHVAEAPLRITRERFETFDAASIRCHEFNQLHPSSICDVVLINDSAKGYTFEY